MQHIVKVRKAQEVKVLRKEEAAQRRNHSKLLGTNYWRYKSHLKYFYLKKGRLLLACTGKIEIGASFCVGSAVTVCILQRPRHEGSCPFCQMPFAVLTIESPRWHVTECMDLPLIATQGTKAF